jgi:FMN phosphatase YigB (HAD superfamily)
VIKLVIFDLHGTLARPNVVTDEYDASRYLIERGYDVYPQELRAAWQYVCFIDLPRHGFKDYPSMLVKTMERLDIEVDDGSINGLAMLYQQNDYTLFEDAEPAVRRVKEVNLKTAIATTPPRFWYERDLKGILEQIDLLCTGAVAGCEKSNPKMYHTIISHFDLEPKECVVIGDGEYIDILLPNSLGMRTILLDRNTTGKTHSVAHATVNTLHEAMYEVRILLG